jgi:uncharacterized membrane protein
MAVLIGILLSILFMLIMRFTAGCFVYLLLALTIVACLVLGIYLIAVPNTTYAGIPINRTFVVVVGALLIVFGIVIAVGFICFRKRIHLAAVIVQTAARFVK